MEREEKRFRGKVMNISLEPDVEIDFNDWVYGGLIYDSVDDEFNIVTLDDEDGRPILFNPKQDTICETTFKHDSQGELVFEWDILNHISASGTLSFFIVVRDNGVLGITPLASYKNDLWQHNTIAVNSFIGQEILHDSKVVGNTIDEPEWSKIY